MILRPKSAGPGGTEYDKDTFTAAELRADLCRIANDIHYLAGAKIVDALLAEYTVHPKKGIGRRKKDVDPG